MGELVRFNGITRLDTDAQSVLQSALEADMDVVVIVGSTKDGEEYFASSVADGGTALWFLERLKAKLLAVPDRDEYK